MSVERATGPMPEERSSDERLAGKPREKRRRGKRSSKAPSTRITLLTRLREGRDTEAWRTFVDLYTPLVYRFCRSRGLQNADAQDVTQQVMAIVHRSIGGFHYDPARGRFRNWLGAVTAHEITRHQRKDRRPGKGAGDGLGDLVAELEEASVDPAWIDEFNAYVFQRACERIAGEFDPLTWQAFELMHSSHCTPREAAERVYKAKCRVNARLKQELQFLTNDAPVFHKP
jgi:RNA polymerase sigma-70 factor, ECF subfamily